MALTDAKGGYGRTEREPRMCSDEQGDLMPSIVEEQLESIRIDRSDPSKHIDLNKKRGASTIEGIRYSTAHRCTCGLRRWGPTPPESILLWGELPLQVEAPDHHIALRWPEDSCKIASM